ncbi:acetyltransferase [Phyllobacterium sp. YR531]|nr:acetyltransferase [Phyllobacterium sp. YR531]
MLGIVRDCTTFLIEEDDQIVGMNAVRIVDVSGQKNARFRKFAFIMAIGVDEAKRRQGYGTALVNHMLEWLPQQDVDMVCLNVSAQNIAAQSFYQHMGFGTTFVQMSRLVSETRADD